MARNNYPNHGENTNIYTDVGYYGNNAAPASPTATVPAGHQGTEAFDDTSRKLGNETEPMEENTGETQIDDMLTGTDVPQTVGWLICIKGSCKGRDFRLHNGWNYIGRSSKSDVCVDDPKISSTMARVSYDSRNRAFAISTSEGAKNLTYCNNKAVYNTVEINAYDTISMGDSDFIFVPLCGPHFNWEE